MGGLLLDCGVSMQQGIVERDLINDRYVLRARGIKASARASPSGRGQAPVVGLEPSADKAEQ
jgi:hypothetical protein